MLLFFSMPPSGGEHWQRTTSSYQLVPSGVAIADHLAPSHQPSVNTIFTPSINLLWGLPPYLLPGSSISCILPNIHHPCSARVQPSQTLLINFVSKLLDLSCPSDVHWKNLASLTLKLRARSSVCVCRFHILYTIHHSRSHCHVTHLPIHSCYIILQ